MSDKSKFLYSFTKILKFRSFLDTSTPPLNFLTFVFETTCFSEDFGIKILKIGLKLSSQWFLIFFVFYEENGDFSYFSKKIADISKTITDRMFIFFLFFRSFQVLKNEKKSAL